MSSFIRPNRNEVSRSFPVLGFTVQTTSSPAWFEIALATDPTLFGPEAVARRTAANFWTSRSIGPQVAPRGDGIFLAPTDVLARFAGRKKLYYAMAVFASPAGEVPELIVPTATAAPYVSLSESYTGTSRRLRTGPSMTRPFTSTPESFAWAGDAAHPAVVEKVPAAAGTAAHAAPAAPATSAPVAGGGGTATLVAPPHRATSQSLLYDDGFGDKFWEQAYPLEDVPVAPQSPAPSDDPEQYGIDGPPPDLGAPPAPSPTPSPAPAGGTTATSQAVLAASLDYQGVNRFVAAHPTNFKVGRSATIDRIVIHITDARTTASTVNWFSVQHPAGRESSSHYLIGQDAEVVQFVHEQDTAYHTRGANSRSIGIEHVATRGFNPTEAEYCASARLVRDIASRYNIPCDRQHILGHNEITNNHPGCPTDAWDWDHYMQLVTSGSCDAPPVGDFPLPSGDTRVAELGVRALGDEPQNWGSSFPTGPVPCGSYGDTWALVRGSGADGLELRVGGTIAWRYNNPGNIRPGRMPYARAINVGQPSGFAIFPTYAEGRQALADLLRTRRYGPLPLTQMFYTYLGMKPGVPSDQGDPEAYARGVIARTGLDGSRTVDSLDEGELGRLMDAIETTEGSRPGAAYHPGDTNIPAQFAPMLAVTTPADQSSPSSAPAPDASTAHSGDAAPTAAQTLGQSVDFTWPDIELVAQPTNWSCWAAAASMVVGWRDRVSIDPTAIASNTGHWVNYNTITTGLNPDDVGTLATSWRLATVPPQSYTVDGFSQLLENHGPLWMGIKVPGSAHAICIYGIYGDGTPDNTWVRIMDPWPPNRGERRVQKFADLEAEYEGMANTNAQGNVNFQILSAGSTDGRTPTYASSPSAQALDTAPPPAAPAPATPPATPAAAYPGQMQITTSSGATGDVTWSIDRGDGALAPFGDESQVGSPDSYRTQNVTVHGPEVTPGTAVAVPTDFVVTWRTNGRAVADIVIAPVPTSAQGASRMNVRAEIAPRPEAVMTVAGGLPVAAVGVRFTFTVEGGAERGQTILSLFGSGDVRTEGAWQRG